MSTRTMNVKISLVVKTTAEWAAEATVITKGMPVVEQTADGYMMKVGDGVNTFADLPYVAGPVKDLTNEMVVEALGYTPFDAAKLGVPNGAASLDENGKILAAQLPDSVDEIIEVDSIDAAPAEGQKSKIYVDIATGLTYRWSGTAYVEISKSILVTASETNGNIKINGEEVVVYTPEALDTAMSDTSTKAVQNKVVSAALATKVDASDDLVLNCTLV